MIAAITSQTNMIYCFNNAHSPTHTIVQRGSLVYDLNATTGAQIWNLMSWDDGGQFVANGGAIADGEWVYDNVYDMEITAVGQGPSAINCYGTSNRWIRRYSSSDKRYSNGYFRRHKAK